MLKQRSYEKKCKTYVVRHSNMINVQLLLIRTLFKVLFFQFRFFWKSDSVNLYSELLGPDLHLLTLFPRCPWPRSETSGLPRGTSSEARDPARSSTEAATTADKRGAIVYGSSESLRALATEAGGEVPFKYPISRQEKKKTVANWVSGKAFYRVHWLKNRPVKPRHQGGEKSGRKLHGRKKERSGVEWNGKQ